MKATDVFGQASRLDLQHLQLVLPGVDLQSAEVAAPVAAAWWLHQELLRAPFIPVQGRSVLLAQLWPKLAEIAAAWETKPPKHNAFVVVFINARWATWTGKHGLLDLTTGEDDLSAPNFRVTSLAYDVGALFGSRTHAINNPAT